MNSMNNQHFFDLAMKISADHATDAERAELEALLAHEPELKAEFDRLQMDVGTVREALPIIDAVQAIRGELPAYASGRLQTKVRETLGQPTREKKSDWGLVWKWRWVLGLAATAAVVLLIVLPMFRTPT